MFDLEKVQNRDLRELDKLEQYLKDKNIKYERRDECEGRFDFHQIISESAEDWKWDVICHYGSYGCDEGLLEIMVGDDEPEGWLTADDVIKRIEGGTMNGYFELIEKADKINDLYSKDEILEVFDELESKLRDARNEICEMCGKYKDNHITHACDNRCYWGM